MTERSFERLGHVVDAVQDAASLQEALDRIVVALRPEFDLWSANITRFVSADAVRVLASWSTVESVFVAGTDVSVHHTDATSEIAATLQRGYPVVARLSEVDFGIISSILASEGAASAAWIPIHDAGAVSALISLTSASPDALTPESIPLFTGLGRGVENKVMELIRGEDRSRHPAAGPQGHA